MLLAPKVLVGGKDLKIIGYNYNTKLDQQIMTLHNSLQFNKLGINEKVAKI